MKEYRVGDIVKGKVTGIEDYGIFVLVDADTTGLIHISEISENFVRSVSDYAVVGEIISAKIIDYDSENNKLKLSIKDNCLNKTTKLVPIKETSSGFATLGIQLETWINEKNDELKN